MVDVLHAAVERPAEPVVLDPVEPAGHAVAGSVVLVQALRELDGAGKAQLHCPRDYQVQADSNDYTGEKKRFFLASITGESYPPWVLKRKWLIIMRRNKRCTSEKYGLCTILGV